jgi:galactokinase/mevalonate kinase-like predicted kinase
MSTRTVEATAPCRVDLAGGTLGGWPLELLPPGAVSVSAAIDRRAWCRVERDVEGLHVASKDTLQKASAGTVTELIENGRLPLVAQVLRVLGVETGLSVETWSRVPLESGLGASSALAVAVGAAVSTVLGRALAPERLWLLLREAEEAWIAGQPTDVQDYAPALHGGVQAVHVEQGTVRAEALSVDPARVEESLLLIDAGDGGAGESVPGEALGRPAAVDEATRKALERIASIARSTREALVEDRLDDVVELFGEEWEARKRLDPEITTPQMDRLAAVASAAGGAAKPCGPGGRGVAAVWAPPGARAPGRREAVSEALAAAGFRVFRARVDLRGLEVE